MPIDIQDFGGTAPSIAPHALGANQATVATNCRLGSADIRPCARMRPDHSNLGVVMQSIYRHEGNWIEREDKGWRFALGPIITNPQRLYMTAPGGGAYIWRDGVQTKLGSVPPAAKPVLAASGGDANSVAETRVYLFTCVSAYGEESAPSPVSDAVTALTGGTVQVTNLLTPANEGYSPIAYKNIYRSATGNSGTAQYMFVAQIPASQTSYADTLLTAALGEELPSLGWAVPPANLQGLLTLPGGMIAGFDGREVRLSAPWEPHAWPDAYANSIQHDIVQIAVSGTTLFILTSGPAYYMSISDPTSAVPVLMPGDIPAVNPSAVVQTPAGVVYASKDGLYLVDAGYTTPVLLTRMYFSEADWRNMNPDSMFGAFHADQLFLFYTDLFGSRGGMIFDRITTASTVYITGAVNTSSDLRFTDTAVDACCVVPDGRSLYVASDCYVQEWEGDGSYGMDATWKSKEFISPVAGNYPVAMVDADYNATVDPVVLQAELNRELSIVLELTGGIIGGAIGAEQTGMVPFASDMLGAIAPHFDPAQYVANTVEFSLWGDGVLRYSGVISSDAPFVLPAGYMARKWYVQVRANVPVHRIAVYESMGELLT